MTHFRFTVLCILGVMICCVAYMNPFDPLKMIVFMLAGGAIGFAIYPVGSTIKHKVSKD